VDIGLSILLWCMLMGAVVGFMAGLLGIGGGLIMVPAMLYLFMHQLQMSVDLAMPMAIATSLSTIIFTSFSATLAHYRLGNLNRFIMVYSGVGIAIGALLGAQLASIIPGDILKKLFAVLVLVLVAYMLLGKRKESQHGVSKPRLSTIGFGTGLLSALMGIGGGAILVPALVWFRVNIKQAIGCASFSGILVAVFASLSFVQSGWSLQHLPEWSFGYVYLPATVGIVIVSVFTANLGAKVSHRLNTVLLKRIFAGFLLLVSLRMLLG
jgi:uncharacterized protein